MERRYRKYFRTSRLHLFFVFGHRTQVNLEQPILLCIVSIGQEYHCRIDIELAKEDRLPEPVVDYLPSTSISPESMTGKVVLALGGIGMTIEYTMMVLFIWKRNCPVIRAASLIPSLIIMFGKV